MRLYGVVAPTFWTGTTGRHLKGPPDDRLLALYLITCPHANMIGLYYLPIGYIALDLGIPLEGASKGLRRASEGGFAHYDEPSEFVWVPEMARFQVAPSLEPSDKRVKGIQKLYDSLPQNLFLHEFYAKWGNKFHLKKRPDSQAPSKGLQSPSQAPSKPGAGTGTGEGPGSGPGPSASGGGEMTVMPSNGIEPKPPTPQHKDFQWLSFDFYVTRKALGDDFFDPWLARHLGDCKDVVEKLARGDVQEARRRARNLVLWNRHQPNYYKIIPQTLRSQWTRLNDPPHLEGTSRAELEAQSFQIQSDEIKARIMAGG